LKIIILILIILHQSTIRNIITRYPAISVDNYDKTITLYLL